MQKAGKSILEINLARVVENYKTMSKSIKTGCIVAPVVKANGYGLGAAPISESLYKSGCKAFCVAYVEEAIQIREKIPSAEIYVFHGVQQSDLEIAHRKNLIPVLNDLYQIELWNSYAAKNNKKLPAVIHVDTGMGRLGLTESNIEKIANNEDFCSFIDIKYIMSHPSCADDPERKENAKQLEELKKISALFPDTKISFANSAAIMLGNEYHFDMVRPGCSLYGINPMPSKPTPVQQVATLKAEVIQIRNIEKDQAISYSGRYQAKKGDRIATVLCGYADGYLRCLTGKGSAHFEGMRLPIVGTVTMDMVMIDISKVPENRLQYMNYVELLGDHITVDELAQSANTIGYEILTSLGNRFKRVYVE